MMRTLLAVAGLLLVSGKSSGGDVDHKKNAMCALHGAEAVDEMLDAALYIWASVQRCEEPGDTLRCEINIASAAESVNGMINVILKAVQGCGELNTKHQQCGLAAGVLTKSISGLAASAGGMVAHCPQMGVAKAGLQTYKGNMANVKQYGHSTFGACVVDVKGSMKSLFQSVKRMMTVKERCDDPHSTACVHNALKIVAAFAGMGEFLAGAVNHCEKGGNADAACSQEVIGLVHQLHNVGRAAIEMKKHCDVTAAERLYLDNEDDEFLTPASTGSNFVTLSLAALLPITAVLAFVGGSRIAGKRTTRTFSPAVAQEFEPLATEE